jgi:integrase
LRNRILPYFKDTPIDKINSRFINEWKNILIKDDIKSSYIRICYRHLSAVFRYAVEYYNLPHSPCTGLGKLPPDKKEINYWTLDDFRLFATTLRKPTHIMIFYLLFWTGLRIGEALALTWSDVDLTQNTININKTLTRLDCEDIITPPKTDNSNRMVFLPQFIADMLRDYKRISEYASDRVFDITRDSVFEKLRNSSIRLGLKPIRIHDLRHSHASLLINAGFSPIEVADRLGHANASTTLKIYSHFYTHKRNELAEKINKLM